MIIEQNKYLKITSLIFFINPDNKACTVYSFSLGILPFNLVSFEITFAVFYLPLHY